MEVSDGLFYPYAGALTLTGLLLFTLTITGLGQDVRSRIINTLVGLVFAGYGIYLLFLHDGGEFRFHPYAFILPVFLVAHAIKNAVAAKREAGTAGVAGGSGAAGGFEGGQGYGQPPYPQPGYPQQPYPQQAYPPQPYPQQAYPQQAYIPAQAPPHEPYGAPPERPQSPAYGRARPQPSAYAVPDGGEHGPATPLPAASGQLYGRAVRPPEGYGPPAMADPYPQPGYAQPGSAQPAYAQQAYPQPGYAPHGYAQPVDPQRPWDAPPR